MITIPRHKETGEILERRQELDTDDNFLDRTPGPMSLSPLVLMGRAGERLSKFGSPRVPA